MNQFIKVSLCALFLSLVCFPSSKAESPHVWNRSFEDAQKKARQTGANLLIHFYADWCGPCKAMDRTVLSSAEVSRELSIGLVAAKVNIDHRQDLARRFKIKSIPADVFLSPDGRVIAKKSGQQSRQGYVATLKRFQSIRRIHTQDASKNTLIAKAANDTTKGPAHPRTDRRATKPNDTAEESKAPRPHLTNALVTVDDRQLGLGGYCPVALSAKMQWSAGRKDVTHVHEGIQYRFANVEALNLFRANPDKYVPVLHGCDAVNLERRSTLESGAIELGAKYRNRIYFFKSKANRDAFLKTPGLFVQPETMSVVQTEVDSNPGL